MSSRRVAGSRLDKGDSKGDSEVRALLQLLVAAVALIGTATSASAEEPAAIASRFAEVNGVKIHYLIAGSGDPVLLLHGYAQTGHMWLPLIPLLAKTHTVIAPDLRGFGD